jgi:hypothetical protein
MTHSAIHHHDPESIHRAAALLRAYHTDNERWWIATLGADTRENGPYTVMCAMAALTDRLINLIAEWSGGDHDTILTNNELAIIKLARQAVDEEASE